MRVHVRGALPVLLAGVLLVGCGDQDPDSASTPSATPSGDASTSNPCLGAGGPADAPDSGPDTDQYLGLSEQEADDLAQDNGFTLRVAGRDGECFALTMDYRQDRVNVYLDDDVVTAATIG